MQISIRHACVAPDDQPFDVAERKGVGHPDSLADLVADAFSQRYSSWCLREFGAIPNHWVDKVNLVGAAADVRFGGFDIRKPADCYLFGKITDRVGEVQVPVEELFREVVLDVLPAALGDGRILEHLRLHINNTRGSAVDHDPRFYRPGTARDIRAVLEVESVANDTVVCVGTSRRGLAADLAVELERRLTSAAFRLDVPAAGTDVKVMVVRVGSTLEVTAALPLHPERVGSWAAYRVALGEAQEVVAAELKALLDRDPRARNITALALHLNTKDVPGRGYLAPFGTSLGKGDCGAVGRGNRYSGVIEPLRPASGEAPAGKNPVHHGGKIYTAVAAEAARRVLAELSVYAEVTIVARNGGDLDAPAHVLVSVDRALDTATTARIEKVVRRAIATTPTFASRFLDVDPLARFRDGDWL
ncbi:S-adenosylmethionine synthetase [Micromonospora qiuiae]|uniref:S-adenosylmethionine synthetase n=1 Tax=Micromonospora qiuiae TaxID=502268 RepID=A0ABQ4JF39_9ACTN|nr:methionine adenosyltransferase [Micromonospora qiuiae]GIJ28855.1 S-adenosylmethionine synthetase [Micromonospora qiuiae]